MNDRAHMPVFLIFSARNCMASLKIKYAAIIISSPHSRGLISVTARQYVNSSQKTVPTEQKAPEKKVLFWYDPDETGYQI